MAGTWQTVAVTAIAVALIAIIVAVYEHIKARKILNRIDVMITNAIDGNFTYSTIDESLLSEVEFKMSKYLGNSEHAASNVREEKRTLTELISDISHQTKTPLANIKLYAEMLREKDLSEEDKDNVERLYSQTEKLEFLIRSLIKMSRLETGILKLNPTRHSVETMLCKIREQYIAMAREKNLEFNVDIVDEYAVFDEKWTIEAVGNIVDNAIKYTDNGVVSVTVDCYEMFLCIKVADSGSGISEEEHGKVFQRFERSASHADSDGVGIGLYLAREILRQENGYIKLHSEVGKGSVFYVYLPFA